MDTFIPGERQKSIFLEKNEQVLRGQDEKWFEKFFHKVGQPPAPM